MGSAHAVLQHMISLDKAMGSNDLRMPEPIVITGRHWSAFLSFVDAIPSRVANNRHVENRAIGNVLGGDSDGFQIQGSNSFGKP